MGSSQSASNAMAPIIPAHQIHLPWMPKPSVNFGCPTGLEYLSDLSELYMEKALETGSIGAIGYTYFIKNSKNELIYQVTEGSRLGGFATVDYGIHMFDQNSKEVIGMEMPIGVNLLKGADYKIYSPVQTGKMLLGTFCHNRMVSGRYASHSLLNESNQEILKIFGGGYPYENQIVFEIRDPSGSNVLGYYTKPSLGTGVLKFPADLCVKAKAILLAVLFIIDDQNPQRRRHHYNY